MSSPPLTPRTAREEILRAFEHDLRIPVANILGFVDLLRDTAPTPYTGEQLEFFERIEDNCRTLLAMCDRLRVTARTPDA
jgi:signal transduction histidine kinase